MRKLFTVLVLVFVAFNSASQIKQIEVAKRELIGKISPLGNLVISLEKSGSEEYIFTYRDVSLSPLDVYKSFRFKETGNDLDSLYSIIMRGFEEKPREAIVIEVPNGKLYLNYDSNMGVSSLIISSSRDTEASGYCRALTKRDVNKLFGKR